MSTFRALANLVHSCLPALPPPSYAVSLPLNFHLLHEHETPIVQSLSHDGYKCEFEPENFKRRLWLGGSVKWLQTVSSSKTLQVSSSLVSSTSKRHYTIVEILKSFRHNDYECIADSRKLIYLQNLNSKAEYAKTTVPTSSHSTELKLDNLQLFLYSLLTNNPHRIHYDLQYAQAEGYPQCLVHGPLICTLALHTVSCYIQQPISKFDYSMLSPIYANEKWWIRLSKDLIWAETERGVAMKGFYYH